MKWHTAVTGAKYATVSEWSIRQAVKDGELEAHPIGKGRTYRITEQAIDEWLLSRSWEPASERGA